MGRVLCRLGWHLCEHRTSGFVESYRCIRCPYLRVWWATFT